MNHQVYPNTTSIAGEVVEVTDLGESKAHGYKVVLTLHNPHKQRESFSMNVKVVLYGKQAEKYMTAHGNPPINQTIILITGRLAVEKDGSMFVIAHKFHPMEALT